MLRRTLPLLLVLLCGLLLLTPQDAAAHSSDYVSYTGGHPIPYQNGGGWCNDHEQHFHAFSPDDYYLFSEYDGSLFFIGDPTDFGYTGTQYAYWGHHRVDIPLNNGLFVSVGYCYIPGPHTHPFAPSQDALGVYYQRNLYNGVYYYYWYTDLWSYPAYVRYYDTYNDYWNVSFPSYYPHCSPKRDHEVSWAPKRKTKLYGKNKGSNAYDENNAGGYGSSSSNSYGTNGSGYGSNGNGSYGGGYGSTSAGSSNGNSYGSAGSNGSNSYGSGKPSYGSSSASNSYGSGKPSYGSSSGSNSYGSGKPSYGSSSNGYGSGKPSYGVSSGSNSYGSSVVTPGSSNGSGNAPTKGNYGKSFGSNGSSSGYGAASGTSSSSKGYSASKTEKSEKSEKSEKNEPKKGYSVGKKSK